MEYKQVILLRADLKLPKGKIAAQAAHASVDGVLKQLSAIGGKEKVKAWRLVGMKKNYIDMCNKQKMQDSLPQSLLMLEKLLSRQVQ